MTRPTLANLAARLDTVEAELDALKSLRASDGLNPAELAAAYEYDNRARALRVHGYVWTAASPAPGEQVRVTVAEAVAACAANGYTPSRQTVQMCLTQLVGLKLAAYLGPRQGVRGTPDEWGLMAPPRPAPAPRR